MTTRHSLARRPQSTQCLRRRALVLTSGHSLTRHILLVVWLKERWATLLGGFSAKQSSQSAPRITARRPWADAVNGASSALFSSTSVRSCTGVGFPSSVKSGLPFRLSGKRLFQGRWGGGSMHCEERSSTPCDCEPERVVAASVLKLRLLLRTALAWWPRLERWPRHRRPPHRKQQLYSLHV